MIYDLFALGFRSTFLVDRHAGVVSEPRVHELLGSIEEV